MTTGNSGRVFRQCGCRDHTTGKRRGASCPKLGDPGHGHWYFACAVSDLWGRRQRIRRGGFLSRTAAVRARNIVLRRSCEQATAHLWTVERWLGFWLSTRRTIRPNTARCYRTHIEQHLIPHIGRIRLAELTARDISAMFAALAATPTRRGTPYSPAMLQRIRATLRAALNGAIREGLLRDNPARRVELANPHRPHAIVWNEQRIKDYQRTGDRQPVAVWTAKQLAYFLDHAADDRLHALWRIIALRGLRRGEAAGLRWCDIDLKNKTLTIAQQITTIDGKLLIGPPKSRASRRFVALDSDSARILHRHARKQRAEAATAGHGWTDTGYVFTRLDGAPINPNYLTYRFRTLVRQSGLPPIRLHDLRHGAASLAHAAGADLKTIQDQLGHASIVLTADTYTSVLDTAQHRAAAATARLVRQAAHDTADKIRHRRPTPSPTASASPTLTTTEPENPPSPAKTRPKTKKQRAKTRQPRAHHHRNRTRR